MKRPHVIRSGITRITRDNLAYGSGPSVEMKLVRELAWVLQEAEERCSVSVSWPNQEKAAAYFNEHGFVETLKYMISLRAALPEVPAQSEEE